MRVVAQAAGNEALALAIVLAVIYLLLVRFMDLNEKEPFWALGVVFAIGAIAAVVLYSAVGSARLETGLVAGPLLREIGKILAVGVALYVLQVLGRGRGWSEVNGALDGVVYGMAVGLGFATGIVFVQELLAQQGLAFGLPTPSAIEQLWTLGLRGLVEGLFGAIIGAGFGLAAVEKNRGRRPLLVAGAAGCAIVLHVAFNLLTRGLAATASGRALALVGLFLPLVLVGAIIVWSLRQERSIIQTELAAERHSGVISDTDMHLLSSFAARRGAYLKRLSSGDFGGWADLKALHNRQVQLAFAKHRAAHDSTAQEEVEHLRSAVVAFRTAAAPGAATAPAAPDANGGV